MPKKRKNPSETNEINQKLIEDHKQIFKILDKVQTNEIYHKNYKNELREIYEKVSLFMSVIMIREYSLLFATADGTR